VLLARLDVECQSIDEQLSPLRHTDVACTAGTGENRYGEVHRLIAQVLGCAFESTRVANDVRSDRLDAERRPFERRPLFHHIECVSEGSVRKNAKLPFLEKHTLHGAVVLLQYGEQRRDQFRCYGVFVHGKSNADISSSIPRSCFASVSTIFPCGLISA